MALMPDLERDLRSIPAQRELLQLRLLRTVAHAVDAGIPQRVIAANLGVAQPEVSRIVKKLRLQPWARRRSPREVLLEHAAQLIDHDAMMTELTAWDYTYGHDADDDPIGDSYIRGSWDQIERAGDLLSDEDYRALLDATADRRAQANAR
ncbi:hypothetical protein DK926_24205 [Rhodococcus sp. Eu-32]|uniref:hypothetical protein n=1 Tax=Rhodococcus sp. Eu-32 TaxID=1017319 RepID=UPI000DF2EA3E|nr:hypothetical protein [Rhodococcus sp. Eu-32]RRQ25285.1 hypothetical protein DK926_24205 [Rhodococcus sp. Eu-32]